MDKAVELFEKRLFDLANRTAARDVVMFTDFMNLNELNIFHSNSQKFSVNWKTFGGYDLAERQMAAFIPDALYYEWDYPICSLKIEALHTKYADALTHRDYLGAIINLGLERRTIGDILVADHHAHIFCLKSMSDFICDELTRVKNTAVICREVKTEEFVVDLKTELVSGTVASVRLDSVLALAIRSSRSSLVGLIEGGKVYVNGKLIVSNGYTLKEQDVISVRGTGKFRYLRTVSTTKKGRFLVEIEKYI